MGIAMEDAEVEREHRQDERGKGGVEPGAGCHYDFGLEISASVTAAEKLRLSFADLFRRGIFDVRRHGPAETKRVFELPIAVAPELIGYRHCGLTAGGDGLRV